MVSSTPPRLLTGMAGFAATIDDPHSISDVPPPLPPRLRKTTQKCVCRPSSSTASSTYSVAAKCIDDYHLRPVNLDPPQSDFDENSIGFVDIQELRKLEDMDNVSVPSLPTPSPFKRRTFVLRKLIPRCPPRRVCGYSTLDDTIKDSATDLLVDFAHCRKHSSFDAPSIVLPYPPKKKCSVRRTFKRLIFCGSR